MSIWRGNDLRILHEHLGLKVGDVWSVDGPVDRHTAWRIDGGIVVRVVSVWLALWYLLLNRPIEGVWLVMRPGFRRPIMAGGKRVGIEDEPDVGNPDVILDYETYAQMLVGLRRPALPSLEMCGRDAGEED